MSTTYAFSYALNFGTLASAVVTMFLSIFQRRGASQEKEDVLIWQYKEKYPVVPHRWFIALFVTMMVLSVFVCERWNTGLPWWAFLVVQLIQFVFILPFGMIRGTTGIRIGIFGSWRSY